MMITEMLDRLLDMAKHDADLKEKLLKTMQSNNPGAGFCKIATEIGFPMTVMDIVNQGEEFYAEIKRSTNGGGSIPTTTPKRKHLKSSISASYGIRHKSDMALVYYDLFLPS